MLLNLFFFNFYFLLLGSVLMGVSCNNMFSCWLLLEMNMMMFTVLLIMKEVGDSGQLGMQYFVIQSFGSATFFFSCCFDQLLFPLMSGGFLMLSLMLKLGCFPFFQWYLGILMKCSWGNFLVLSTFQKILPLFLLSTLMMNKMLMIGVLGSVLLSCLASMGESETKKILGYSSLFNVGWLLSLIPSMGVLVLFISAYAMALFLLIILISGSSAWHSGVMNSLKFNLVQKICFLGGVLSMGGFPPFIGFWAKLGAVMFMLSLNMYFMVSFLLVSSFFIMFIYLNMGMIVLMEEGLSIYGGSSTSSGGGIFMLVSILIMPYF